MKRVGMPACFRRALIALPPPWTITGFIPAHSMKTMSRTTPRVHSGSSIAEPPNFTTTRLFRNSWI